MSDETRVLIEKSLASLPPLLSTDEAEKILHCCRRSLTRWIASGKLRVVKTSPTRTGKVLIPREAVVEFIVANFQINQSPVKGART